MHFPKFSLKKKQAGKPAQDDHWQSQQGRYWKTWVRKSLINDIFESSSLTSASYLNAIEPLCRVYQIQPTGYEYIHSEGLKFWKCEMS